jgi:molecular chaperone GrpE
MSSEKMKEEVTNNGVFAKSVKVKVNGYPEEPVLPAKEAFENTEEGVEEKLLEDLEKADLIQKVKETQEEAQKNYDLYLRSQADIENIKKRNRKEKEDWVRYANETLIKEILPVMDNLEMAIAHSRDGNSLDALREGVELTLKGLIGALEKSGLDLVKAKGETFDPSFHEAVSQQEDDKVEAGKVIHEIQKGYLLNNRLIRPAMVVVSKGKPRQAADGNKPPEE